MRALHHLGAGNLSLNLYLDTSVISAYFDVRRPERQGETQAFWKKLPDFHVSISDLTESELRAISDEQLRQKILELAQPFGIIRLDEEMRELAKYYLDRGIFPPAAVNDALHVACAVVIRQDLLVSWNFRHLVNRRRRAMINQENLSRGYPTIEIVAPPEV